MSSITQDRLDRSPDLPAAGTDDDAPKLRILGAW